MGSALDMFRESGFARLVLFLILIWTVAAVAMLVETLVEADEINDQAAVISDNLDNANRDLEAVAKLQKTVRLARAIDSELEPLPRLLGEEVAVTHSIDRNARQILAEAGSIRARVFLLENLVASVAGRVDSIAAHARSIRGDATSIASFLAPTLEVAQSIDAGVAGINARADLAIEQAARIQHDTELVRRQAGPEHRVRGVGSTIAGHAHSIDCSALISPDQPYCR